MKKFLRRAAVAVSAAVVSAACIFSAGCIQLVPGPAGPKGDDLDFYDLFDALNAEREANGEEPLTVSQFVEMYMDYISPDVEQTLSRQAAINRSLLSSVAILSQYSSGSKYNVYAGSGVIVDIDREAGDAYIVTNAHVAYDTEVTMSYCNRFYIYFYGADTAGVDYAATTSGEVINYTGVEAEDIQLIGISLAYDLVVLRVDDSDAIKNSRAVAAQFVQEDVYNVGEEVYAIGNPDGAGLSATTGIISRDSEYISVMVDDIREYRVMRTDTAINGGNSGGGLFNYDGQIVGIVNSKDEEDGTDNIGFALPSSYARRVVQSIIDNYETSGASRRVFRYQIGIDAVVSGSYAYTDDQTGLTEITEVVTVGKVSGAANGIIQPGDVIKSFAVGTSDLGRSVLSSQAESSFTLPVQPYTVAQHYFEFDVTREYMIRDAMFSVRSGDTVCVEIERDGATYYAYFVFSGNSNRISIE